MANTLSNPGASGSGGTGIGVAFVGAASTLVFQISGYWLSLGLLSEKAIILKEMESRRRPPSIFQRFCTHTSPFNNGNNNYHIKI
jgi:hypothetical protein